MKTVLVVDDDEDIRFTLRVVFEGEGYAVALAENGAAALAWLRKMPRPAVVILDLLMPVLDGNAVYRAMQADAQLSDIPVVISTSDPSRAPSGVLIIRKPVNLELLLATVKRCSESAGEAPSSA
jgi:CheY-like chemotaxis protein